MTDIVKEIKNRADIVTIIGEKVKLERKGGRYYGLCPFHQEKSPSFMVSQNTNIYHCFGCKASGDVIKFVMDYEHLSFIETIKLLGARYSINIDKLEVSKISQKEKDIIALMHDACQIYQNNLQELEQKHVREYLKKRGVNESQIDYFSLGYSKADSSIVKGLLKKGYSQSQILESGIAFITEHDTLIDRFKARVIFPIFNERKEVIGFGGRCLDNQQPKYLNSPETELFKKRESLFNIDKAKESARKSNKIYVLEGYMDVVSFVSSGIVNSVAALGTALTQQHLQKLWQYSDSPTICFDGDKAGKAAAYKVAEMAFESISTGRSINFINLPNNMDPDDLIRGANKDFINQELAKTIDLSTYAYEYKLAELSGFSPNEIAVMEKELMDLAAKITDKILQQKYISFFKEKLWQINFRKNNKKGKNTNNSALPKAELNIIIDQIKILELNLLLVFIKFANILMQEENIYHEFVNLELNDNQLSELKFAIIETIHNNTNDIESSLQPHKDILIEMDQSRFLTSHADYNSADIKNIWLLALAKYQLFNLDNEYKKLILLQDEKSLSRASLLLLEMQKYNKEINRLNDLID